MEFCKNFLAMGFTQGAIAQLRQYLIRKILAVPLRSLEELVYQRHNVAVETCFITAQSWTHLLYFALLGLILFLVPRLAAFDRKTLTGCVVTTLYLMGPLAGVMTSLSLFGRANVALQKVESLGVSLAERSTECCSFDQLERAATFRQLEIDGIVHSYHREQDDSHFVLGPID